MMTHIAYIRVFSRKLLWAFLLFCLLWSSPAFADKALSTLVSSKRFVEAVSLYKAGEFIPSALILEDVAGKMSASPQLSGVIYVMASKAAEKGGSGQAYDLWGVASARFARVGTTWPQVQREFGRRLEMVRLGTSNMALSGAVQGGGHVVSADAGRMLTAWKLFELDTYSRPAKGLKNSKNAGEMWDSVSAKKDGQGVIPYSEALWGEQNAKTPAAVRPPAIAPGRDMGYYRSDSRPQAQVAQAGSISDRQKLAARRAWEYFQRNYQPATGLYNGLDLYPVATCWEMGSALAGMVSAQRLGILSRDDFLRRIQLFLRTLSSMDLYNGELPNRLYFTDTGRMVGEDQQPSNVGIGWSAIDCARLCLWLKVVGSLYPELKAATENVFRRLRTERLIKDGYLQQASIWAGKERLGREGHFGYGPYAARAFELWGARAWGSRDYTAGLKATTIYGVKIPYAAGEGAVLTAKPFFLGLMEFGGTGSDEDKIVTQIYKVQEARYKKRRIYTAVSDGRIDRAPWFAVCGILTDGGEGQWECVSPFADGALDLFWMGADMCYSMDALFSSAYTQKLTGQVESLYVENKGFAVGRYDNGAVNSALTLETNALILEAIWYKRIGKGFLEVGPAQ
jgi:hypothetical protein